MARILNPNVVLRWKLDHSCGTYFATLLGKRIRMTVLVWVFFFAMYSGRNAMHLPDIKLDVADPVHEVQFLESM
jgi:hypothetical protein